MKKPALFRPVEVEAPLLFTEKQRRLLGLVRAGLQNREIAAVIGISTPTVSRYVGRLLGRTHTKNRKELATWAEQHGYVVPAEYSRDLARATPSPRPIDTVRTQGRSAYQVGCRCSICVTANRDYQREYQRTLRQSSRTTPNANSRRGEQD